MSKEESSNRDSMRRYIWAAAVCVVLVLAVYTWRFYGRALGEPAEFGAFGDFVGGVINPLLGFITIWPLVKSLQFQREELANSREELAATRAEMEKGNEIYQSQMELQSRQNVRGQLQQELHSAIDDLQFTLNKRTNIAGEADFILIENAIKKAALKHASTGDRALAEIAQQWDTPAYAAKAYEVRVKLEKVLVSVKALIHYSDNSIITDTLVIKVASLVGRVGRLGIEDSNSVALIKEDLLAAVTSREDLPFPKFKRDSRPLTPKQLEKL